MNTLTTSTETRFNAAVATIENKAITLFINTQACCAGCVDLDTLGINAGDEYAFAYFGNCEGINIETAETEWKNDTLYIGSYVKIEDDCAGCHYDNNDEMIHNNGEGCVEGYDYDEEWFEKEWTRLSFRYSSVEAGNTISAAFTAQGFNVEWDGNFAKTITVTI